MAGRLRSIRQVGDELSAGGDELATWAVGQDDGFFPPPDAAVLVAAQQVSAWVLQQIGLKVDFMSPYQMLRKEQARFILGPAPAAS